MSKIVTRFAPSPTGYLHIGGARTALFNWLFARHCEGQFLLRIEDTDRERSTPEAMKAIEEGLGWLGLPWDGSPHYQSAAAARHRAVAETMLTRGNAYRCYATAEELTAARQAATAAGTRFRFQSPWRDRDPSEGPADTPFAVRLRARREGVTKIADAIQGTVTWKNEAFDDLIMLRSDQTPTYMLAVVVDDHDMGITHVIRGDDHLTNAARQAQIFDAMGWSRPVFAHIPLIHGPDGKKYSKRHGAIGLEAFAAEGFLPEAMRNYLSRLGWAHEDEEFFTTEQAISWFSLEAVGRSAARFDRAKLLSLNASHLRALEPEKALAALLEYLRLYRKTELSDIARARIERLLPALLPRARTLDELAELARFAFDGEMPIADEKARALQTEENRERLAKLTPALFALTIWASDALDTVVKEFAAANSLSLGKVAQPIRAALTGSTVSAGIFDLMVALGREETLRRLARWQDM